MTTIMKSTDVRKDWSRFIDDVTRTRPALVKRNRDLIVVLSLDLIDYILSEYELKVVVEKEKDGSFSGTFKEIDIAANAPDLGSLKEKLAIDIIEYSEEYLDEFIIHYYNPNRKKHFPYIFRVSLRSGDVEEVKKMFDMSIRQDGKQS